MVNLFQEDLVEVEGVVVVDAQTGEVKRYDKGKAPKFVDGVLNHETASALNTYFGKYIHGFWNTKFSQTDMKIPTEWGTKEGVTPIFGKDGTLYYFTDFTSPKKGRFSPRLFISRCTHRQAILL